MPPKDNLHGSLLSQTIKREIEHALNNVRTEMHIEAGIWVGKSHDKYNEIALLLERDIRDAQTTLEDL
jgi:hypothetical protein